MLLTGRIFLFSGVIDCGGEHLNVNNVTISVTRVASLEGSRMG